MEAPTVAPITPPTMAPPVLPVAAPPTPAPIAPPMIAPPMGSWALAGCSGKVSASVKRPAVAILPNIISSSRLASPPEGIIVKLGKGSRRETILASSQRNDFGFESKQAFRQDSLPWIFLVARILNAGVQLF